MTYDEIVALLAYAGGNEQPVRITTTDRSEVLGVPTEYIPHGKIPSIMSRLGLDAAGIAATAHQVAATPTPR